MQLTVPALLLLSPPGMGDDYHHAGAGPAGWGVPKRAAQHSTGCFRVGDMQLQTFQGKAVFLLRIWVKPSMFWIFQGFLVVPNACCRALDGQ